MTQSSTSRNTRTSGLRRPALALAFGTAAVASALAPVASMAATAPVPTYNDSTKIAGSVVDKKPTLILSTILTAMPATPMPTVVTGTSNGDVNQQAILAANASASVKASYVAMVAKYNAWKVARTPVVTAYLAWKNAPAVTAAQKTAKAAKYKFYLAKVAAFNKAGGAAKYTAYKTAFTAYIAKFTPAFATAKKAVKANHFKLTAGTYGGDLTTPAGLCDNSINMTAQQLYDAEIAAGVASPEIGANEGDQANGNLVLRCNGGRIEYYLIKGSDENVKSPYVPAWEFISATATIAAGQVSITTATDATATSLSTYTPYITDYTTGRLSAKPWTLNQVADSKPAFKTYALNLLNKSGAFDPKYAGAATTGKTCISAATTATLTCLSYQYSLQEAINAAVKGMPY